MAINYGKGKNDSDYDLGKSVKKMVLVLVVIEHGGSASVSPVGGG